MTIHGYDISHHNMNPDIQKYPKKDFVVIKATEGIGYVDGQFENNVHKALEIGYTIIGAYHFVRADIVSNTPEDEAINLVETVARINKTEHTISFLAIDIEAKSLSVTDIVNYCKTLISFVREKTTLPILAYVQASQIKRFEVLCEVPGTYLWLADWSCSTIEASASKWKFNKDLVIMHQTGVENKIDVDYADDSFLNSSFSPTLDSRYDEINDILTAIMNDINTVKQLLSELKG